MIFAQSFQKPLLVFLLLAWKVEKLVLTSFISTRWPLNTSTSSTRIWIARGYLWVNGFASTESNFSLQTDVLNDSNNKLFFLHELELLERRMVCLYDVWAVNHGLVNSNNGVLKLLMKKVALFESYWIMSCITMDQSKCIWELEFRTYTVENLHANNLNIFDNQLKFISYVKTSITTKLYDEIWAQRLAETETNQKTESQLNWQIKLVEPEPHV